MMNSQELLSTLQNPQVNERVAQFQATLKADSRLNAYQDKVQSLEAENAELVQRVKNVEKAMIYLIAPLNDASKEQHAASQSREQELESQNAELIEQLKNMKRTVQELVEERDSYKMKIQATNEDAERIREQHTVDINDKDWIIQTLKTRLADSQNNSIRKTEELRKYQTKEFNNDKNLCLQGQECDDKIKLLQEQYAKQIEGKDLELKTQQEQHAKVLNNKDLTIQDLAISRSTAEQQTVDEVIKLTNENNRLSLLVKKQREEIVLSARRYCQKMEDVEVKLTQLQTGIGKLAVELHEVKKPREALMGQLAAKNKKIEYLTKQHEEKLVFLDSEIQNLTNMVQDLQASRLTNSKNPF